MFTQTRHRLTLRNASLALPGSTFTPAVLKGRGSELTGSHRAGRESRARIAADLGEFLKGCLGIRSPLITD